jgi:hypothetical protein
MEKIPVQDKGELTTKALLLLKTYLQSGCNKKITAKKLGKSYMQVLQQLRQPYVKNIFQQVLLESGITFDKLAQKLNEGLEATRLEFGNPNRVPDFYTREKYIKDCLGLFALMDDNNLIDDEVKSIVQNKVVVYIENNIEKNADTSQEGRLSGSVLVEPS